MFLLKNSRSNIQDQLDALTGGGGNYYEPETFFSGKQNNSSGNATILWSENKINIFPDYDNNKDFTVEFWIKFNSLSYSPLLFAIAQGGHALGGENLNFIQSTANNCLITFGAVNGGFAINSPSPFTYITGDSGLHINDCKRQWMHVILQGTAALSGGLYNDQIYTNIGESKMDIIIYRLENDNTKTRYCSYWNLDLYKVYSSNLINDTNVINTSQDCRPPLYYQDYHLAFNNPGSGDGFHMTGLRIFNKKMYREHEHGGHSKYVFDTKQTTNDKVIFDYIDGLGSTGGPNNDRNSILNVQQRVHNGGPSYSFTSITPYPNFDISDYKINNYGSPSP